MIKSKFNVMNMVFAATLAQVSLTATAANPASQDWVKGYVATNQETSFSYIEASDTNQVCTVGVNCGTPSLSQRVIFTKVRAQSSALGAPTYDPTSGIFTINSTGTYRITFNINGSLCDAGIGDSVQYSAGVAGVGGATATVTIVAQADSTNVLTIGGAGNAGLQVIRSLPAGRKLALNYFLGGYSLPAPNNTFYLEPTLSSCAWGNGSSTMMSIEKIG